MCGIAGFIPFHSQSIDILENKAREMGAAITHRGPDDDGMFVDDAGSIMLSFRRLAIVDLSKNGAQPMRSSTGRYVIVFNGEIYNFLDLKTSLEDAGHRFNGGSDTEVMLAAIENWGLDKALEAFNGMFAFALYDTQDHVLHLVRDRMGKKPLYYGHGEDGFYFCSEMKSVLAALPERPKMNRDVAALYLQWRYVPDPYCIYEGFHKLSPGHVVSIDLADTHRIKPRAYWALNDVIKNRNPFEGSREDALSELGSLLKGATERRMIADVPLGAFLSGGVDSSLIVAMMQEHKKVQSFTIAFEDKKYNEAEHAKLIANHLGTDHEEVLVKASDALDTVALLPAMFDEPFGDPSAIPTYQVCRLARNNMIVALSGDGGDESFGGYSWYQRAAKVERIPALLRRLMALGMTGSPQVRKMASILQARGAHETYASLHSYWQVAQKPLLNFQPKILQTPHESLTEDGELLENLMAYDSLMFLPGDVLAKVDRTSMAASLEVRAPLLDQEIVEFAWSLPLHMREGKSLLRDLLRRYLPDEYIDRPKQGFSIPHGKWLANELKDWAEDLLSVPSLERSGMFHAHNIHDIWVQHRDGKADYGHLLWTIVMFQSWHKHWM